MHPAPSALLDDAASRQRRAADPTASVWVAASAGSGKTKVLTDRVLTLLLAGTLPARILCLTFTKAAAAEMNIRINRMLAGWATADAAGLERGLGELLGRAPSAEEQVRARRLFATVLDAPGGMRIETIHAFCQSLLRRFPLEAGLAPHFQVMDERDAAELLEEAKDEILSGARGGEGGDLADALAVITGLIHETGFPELMGELAGDRGRLRRLLAREGGLAGVAASLWRRLGLEPGDSPDGLISAAVADGAFDQPGLIAAARALMTGSDADSQRGQTMADWLAAPDRRARDIAAWTRVFLTQDGTIRKTLATKKVLAVPGVEQALSTEAERMLRLDGRLRSARIASATRALLSLADALLAAYERKKSARAVMDYDDLILSARDLLSAPGVAPWVLYKLDGGIDHILIDEAQDTNPDQWAVVERLAEEFFAGRGAREQVRTVFAVGDVKQSIYSFQRADPAAFDRMRRLFAEHVPAAGQTWAEIPLNLSFRSTRAVLEAVDAVFTGPARDGVLEDGLSADDQRHVAFRQGQAGRVELWPPVAPRAIDEPPPWKPPVERIKGDSPRTRLARLVAARIGAMVGSEMLESQGRPVRAGDIMVLLRRRGGFVEDLVRELKSLGVPVAGADRMVLTEQLAVMDLMALGQVLLLPEDDLTLATVLKGPLIGLGETQLFELAWNRGPVTLWESLRRKAGADQGFAAALDRLTELMALTDRLGPADLYAHILGPLGGKRALLTRLGPDAADPLDEFVNLTLAFERGHPPSLQGFLRWLETGAVEIKRDLEQGGRDAVRIMTVHGSKGLQAPIVFLPDTLQMPTKGPRLLWTGDADEMLLWPPSAESDDETCAAARSARKLAAEREYRRLLYVAMTRAEDHLIVCGWEAKRAAPPGCWYNLIKAGLEPLAEKVDSAFLAAADETEGAKILSLSCPQSAEPDRKGPTGGAHDQPPLPEPSWLTRSPEPEPAPPRPLAPSRPEGEEPPVRSPLGGTDGTARFQRGRLIHRLLELLPDLPREARSKAAIRFLSKAGITQSAQALTIAGEVADILDHSRFAPLFAPGSRAEVPIVGLVGDNRAISGRVDRLVVTEDEVMVVDYKTNRRPPASGDPIPDLYVRQMAAYRLALACIYPGKRVRCALLWTDGPRLMEIDAALMDDALN